MAAQFLWILLVLIEVAQVEQPIFVPSAAGLLDAPPENKQDWLHPVITYSFYLSSYNFLRFCTFYEWF